MSYKKRNKRNDPLSQPNRTERGKNYFKTKDDVLEEMNDRRNRFDDYQAKNPDEYDSLGRLKPVKMTDAEKNMQIAREAQDIYGGLPRTRAKRWRNQQNYRNNLFILDTESGSQMRPTMRMTIPALNEAHIDNAIHRFSELVNDLIGIKKLKIGKRTNSRTKIMLMRSAVYHTHCKLKFDADGYKDTVAEDFVPQNE